MESDDEMLFSPPEEPASPIHRSRLKRLKKGASLTISPALSNLVDAASSEAPDSFDLEVGEVAPDAGIGGLDHGSAEVGVEHSDAVPVAEAVEHVEMMDSGEQGGIGCSIMSQNDQQMEDELGRSEKLPNKGEEEGKKAKKRVKSRVDGETTTPVEGKRLKNGKERKAHLNMMHAESQRLLRETRHVSFQPVPLVHKPISSVLEKIRRRKLELSNRFNLPSTLVKDFESSFDQAQSDRPNALEHGSMDYNKKTDKEITNKYQDVSQCGIKSKKVYQSESSDSEDEQPEEDSYSHEETEKFVPSVLATNLNFESSLEEDSSQEEDYNKENIDPFPDGVDPARTFVDDEAEVESDSDNDPMGSADSKEEGKESDEELEDLIAPTYEETKVDHERRDELHQIWLQQQDTAATENLCQRLRAQNNKDESALRNDDEEDRASLDLDHSDESMANEPPPRGTKKRIKELRQWSLQMFNDDDDIYQSSGDEDEDSVPAHQVHHDRTQEQTSFTSSGSGFDERSREVFGLIKKLNIAPPTKKTVKKTSFLETLVTGSNSNCSLKSSFLSRSNSNSLPSYRNQISKTTRSFVFSRDDSRSGSSTSDVAFNLEQVEQQPKKNASAKYSSSQPTTSSFNARTEPESNSGPSLFQLLRMSSMNSTHGVQRTENTSNSQAKKQFTAFKFSKKIVKMESRS